MTYSMPSKARRVAWTLSTLAVAAALTGCGGKDAASTARAKPQLAAASSTAAQPIVSTIIAGYSEVAHAVKLDAELTTLTSPDIAAEVAGKLQQMLVMPGQAVRRGQVLAVLDSTDLALSAGGAHAQAAQVRADLEEKRRTLGRNEELFAKEYISRSALDASRAAASIATEQLKVAEAQASLSGRALAKSRVVAPYDGVVTTQKAAPGAYVTAGTVLLQLWSPQGVTLRAQVPQDYVGQVQPGQSVELAWQGRTLKSTVLRVTPAVNPTSRSFEAQLEVPAELQGLSGVALQASLALKVERFLTVPAAAVQLNASKSQLVLVEGGKARRVDVQLGAQQDGLVAVVSGLQEGSRVAVTGASFVSDGQSVRVQPAASAAGAGESPR